MDPISLTMSAVGLGMQVWGGFSAADSAQEAAAVSQSIARHEENINKVKQRQMEMEGRRTQLENVRNNQRARAMAENSATNQGAQFGSGLQGGLGQIQAQTLFNMSGVNSALANGREIAGINSLISNDKQQLAQIQGDSAEAQGIASLGGAIMKAGPIVGQISQGFGSFGKSNPYYGPLDYNGR